MHVFMNVETRGQAKCFPQLLSTLVFETRSLIELELDVLARLTGQQAVRIACLALTPALELQAWASMLGY